MNTILQNITSPTEAEILLNFLDQLEQNVHNNKIDVKTFIFENAPFHTGLEMAHYLLTEVEENDIEAIRKKIFLLCTSLREIPIVTLTIAITPSEEFRFSLNQKAEALLGKKIFFELQYDHTIIGGAIVEGNGRVTKHTYKDYFVKKANNTADLLTSSVHEDLRGSSPINADLSVDEPDSAIRKEIPNGL